MLGVLLVALPVGGGCERLLAPLLLAWEAFQALVSVNVSITFVLGGEPLRAHRTLEPLLMLPLYLARHARAVGSHHWLRHHPCRNGSCHPPFAVLRRRGSR